MIRTYQRCRLFRQVVLRVLKSEKSSVAEKSTVAVAMSGGIDSAVAAMILKDQGYDCIGVFMTNWDSSDEAGDITCSIDRDRMHMREVCERLNIPAVDVDFVKDYWNDVFQPFLDSYRSGVETPNPDVMCNRLIKFNRFREHVTNRLGIRTMATGHYVRIDNSAENGSEAGLSAQDRDRDSSPRTSSDGFKPFPRLLRGVDDSKDQSYFLSMTRGEDLKNVLFPLGGLHKQEVKRMAAIRFSGLAVLTKKESMGVCFIGKRNFQEFLSNYFPLTPGRFIDADSGLEIGRHEGKEAFTVGQKANIGGCRDKYFVVSLTDPSAKSYERMQGDVLVAMGVGHPLLYHHSLIVRGDKMSWIAGSPPVEILDQLAALIQGTHSQTEDSTGIYPSAPSSISGSSSSSSSSSCGSSGVSLPGGGRDSAGSRIGFRCGFKARYLQGIELCTVTVRLLSPGTISATLAGVGLGLGPGVPSLFSSPTESAKSSARYTMLNDTSYTMGPHPHPHSRPPQHSYELVVTFDEPHRAITPGQILALYTGEECLGGGIISLSDTPSAVQIESL